MGTKYLSFKIIGGYKFDNIFLINAVPGENMSQNLLINLTDNNDDDETKRYKPDIED